MKRFIITLAISLTSQIVCCQLETGAKAPQINLQHIHNSETTNKFQTSLEGKVTVIDFWATWCKPCIAGLPNLDSLYAKYGSKDVQFVAISDENKEKVIGFIEHKGYKFPVGIDADKSTFKAYNVSSIPRTYIINRKGNIVFTGHKIVESLLIEVIETDQIKAEQVKPAKNDAVSHKIEIAPAVYGEDPVYNTMKKQLNLNENNVSNKISQLIIRPNLNTGIMMGSRKKLDNGYVGLTWYGYPINYLYEDLYGIHSSAWMKDNTNDTLKYDIIYYKKANDLNEAKLEIIKELEDNLSYYLDSVNSVNKVHELYLDKKSKNLSHANTLSEGAQKASISMDFVLFSLERVTGKIHLLDSSLNDMLISDPKISFGFFMDSSEKEIKEYLAKLGIKFRVVEKELTTYQLNIK